MRSVLQCITEDNQETIVSSCILSKLDYCNTQLAGYPKTPIKPLQHKNKLYKSAAKPSRAEQARPLLKQLLWLPLQRIMKYRISCLSFQIMTGTTLQWIVKNVRMRVPCLILPFWHNIGFTCVVSTLCAGLAGLCALVLEVFALPTWNSLPSAFHHSHEFSPCLQTLTLKIVSPNSIFPLWSVCVCVCVCVAVVVVVVVVVDDDDMMMMMMTAFI